VKSLANSKFDSGRVKQAQMQSPLESSIREKEAKLVKMHSFSKVWKRRWKASGEISPLPTEVSGTKST